MGKEQAPWIVWCRDDAYAALVEAAAVTWTRLVTMPISAANEGRYSEDSFGWWHDLLHHWWGIFQQE
jgi:hypothetical protein